MKHKNDGPGRVGRRPSRGQQQHRVGDVETLILRLPPVRRKRRRLPQCTCQASGRCWVCRAFFGLWSAYRAFRAVRP